MSLGKLEELIHVGSDALHAALHGGDSIALPLQADTLSPYGTEFLIGQPCGTASMLPCQIAPEDENLIGLERNDMAGRYSHKGSVCLKLLENLYRK